MMRQIHLGVYAIVMTSPSVFTFGGGDTDCPNVGPDVVVSDIFDSLNWGNLDGEIAFTIGTNACNIGDEVLNWVGDTPDHPVIAQSLYRIKDDRLEQIGTAWLKHGFGAAQVPGCGCTCVPADYQHLGVGCSDAYSAVVNGVQAGLGPRREVNPHTGVFPFPPSGWGQSGNILERRLRTAISDIDPDFNPGSVFLVESQYVTPADAMAGNSANNVSWRSCEFVSGEWTNYYDLALTGETQVGETAVEAWATLDPQVRTERIEVPGDGLVVVGSRVTELAGGWYRYAWAIQNVTCNREIAGLWVGVNEGASVSSVEFHDVELHGEGVDRAPWAFIQEDTFVGWSTESHDINPDANSIRWGTTFTYVLETNSPPAEGSLQLGLFKPGGRSTIDVPATVPEAGDIDPCDLGLGPCPWELDGIPGVTGADLTELLGWWGICGDGTFRPRGDVNGDCCVDGGDLSMLLGFWGVDCTPVGACCIGDETCLGDMTEASCLAMSGLYRGDGSDCQSVTCPESGACCLPDGSCIDQVFTGECAALSGVYAQSSSCETLSCLLAVDACEQAVPLEDGRHLYSTLAATSGGPVHLECETGSDGGVVGNDIWFTYQPVDDGILHLSTCGTVNYDSELLIYAGVDCDDLVLLACNDDATDCAGYSSDVSASVDFGMSYVVRVGGWRGGSLGTGELLVELTSSEGLPDDCSEPLRIEEGIHAFTTIGATTDGPVHPECKIFDKGVTGNDIWFIHTATGTGNLEVSTCGLVDYDSDLVVYANTDCSDLDLLGCNDDDPECAGYSSRVIVPVVEGRDYLIRLGGWAEGEVGSGEFTVQMLAP